MLHDILMVGLGAIGGSALMLILMSLLIISKKSDTETEKMVSYTAGYKKGFEDGSKPQKTI